MRKKPGGLQDERQKLSRPDWRRGPRAGDKRLGRPEQGISASKVGFLKGGMQKSKARANANAKKPQDKSR